MNNIPVFLSSNDKYAPFVATTIASICDNTKEFINFYILDSGISKINKQKILDTKQFFSNFSIEFIKINCNKIFSNYPTLKHISRDMYSRFLIPSILPNSKKVIYSDIDVAFVGDIADLYAIDMQDKILAAVPEYIKEAKKQFDETKNRLNLSKQHEPFCSGLLLLNCHKWKQYNIDTQIFQISQSLVSMKVLKYPDQDILNKVFNNNYLKLDIKYCLIPKHLKSNFAKDKLNEIRKRAVIYHFAGGGISKPWNNKSLEGGSIFWKYVSKTSFTKEIEQIYDKYTKRQNIKKFIQKIFVIRNSANKQFKQITFLGLNLKIPRI